MYYVYGLTTTEHDRLIYIGASKNPEKRLHQHILSRYRKETPLQKRLFDKHDDIGYVVLSTCESWRTALDTEKRFILSYLDMGHPLLNRFHTPSFKQELAKSRIARIERENSPEQVEFRAGVRRVYSILHDCQRYKVSKRKLFKLFPFFAKASEVYYMTAEQHDMMCNEIPSLAKP